MLWNERVLFEEALHAIGENMDFLDALFLHHARHLQGMEDLFHLRAIHQLRCVEVDRVHDALHEVLLLAEVIPSLGDELIL